VRIKEMLILKVATSVHTQKKHTVLSYLILCFAQNVKHNSQIQSTGTSSS